MGVTDKVELPDSGEKALDAPGGTLTPMASPDITNDGENNAPATTLGDVLQDTDPDAPAQTPDTPGKDENGDGLKAGQVGPDAGTQPGDVLGI